jgi:hypothetical protein
MKKTILSFTLLGFAVLAAEFTAPSGPLPVTPVRTNSTGMVIYLVGTNRVDALAMRPPGWKRVFRKWYIDANAKGTGGGTNWANAFTSTSQVTTNSGVWWGDVVYIRNH